MIHCLIKKIDSTNLVEAIKTLSNENLIEEINEFVKSKTCASLSLYCPTSILYKNMVHFVLEGDRNLRLLTISEITSFIKAKVNYDYSVDIDGEYITVLDRELFKIGLFEQRFSVVNKYNIENHSNIIKFFMNYYRHLSPELENYLVAKQLKLSIVSMNKL